MTMFVKIFELKLSICLDQKIPSRASNPCSVGLVREQKSIRISMETARRKDQFESSKMRLGKLKGNPVFPDRAMVHDGLGTDERVVHVSLWIPQARTDHQS